MCWLWQFLSIVREIYLQQILFCVSKMNAGMSLFIFLFFGHSLAGMSRSVTVAVAYIMSVTTLTWREALKVVRAGRAVANPNLGFQRQLQEFETYKLVEVPLYKYNSQVYW